MKYVQFAIFTFPLFNNRKGIAGLLLIFAFLIKILWGLLGELNQQKRRRKSFVCIPPWRATEETGCLLKSVSDGRSLHGPEPSSDSFPSLNRLRASLNSSLPRKMELRSMPPGGQERRDIHGALHLASGPLSQPSLGDSSCVSFWWTRKLTLRGTMPFASLPFHRAYSPGSKRKWFLVFPESSIQLCPHSSSQSQVGSLQFSRLREVK